MDSREYDQVSDTEEVYHVSTKFFLLHLRNSDDVVGNMQQYANWFPVARSLTGKKSKKVFDLFRCASHLYKRVCPSVGPPVRRSVGPSVRRSVQCPAFDFFHLKDLFQ